MTGVGDGGELGENARVPSADFVKLDVRDGLQAPIQTRPLGVGKRRSELLELGCVEEEEVGMEEPERKSVETLPSREREGVLPPATEPTVVGCLLPDELVAEVVG